MERKKARKDFSSANEKFNEPSKFISLQTEPYVLLRIFKFPSMYFVLFARQNRFTSQFSCCVYSKIISVSKIVYLKQFTFVYQWDIKFIVCLEAWDGKKIYKTEHFWMFLLTISRAFEEIFLDLPRMLEGIVKAAFHFTIFFMFYAFSHNRNKILLRIRFFLYFDIFPSRGKKAKK